MALAQSPNTQKPEFKGLPLPDGNERQVLYQSSFRMVATYAMTLAELDNELRKVLNAKRVIVKVDDRHNFVGKRACHPPLGPSGYLCIAHRGWPMRVANAPPELPPLSTAGRPTHVLARRGWPFLIAHLPSSD
tara:strand:- start:148 stop:546 length:399 start_codon:yes stop_codon:yes gene_type:complete